MTADPYAGSAKARSPKTWNRYSYTFGDPVNHSDPTGRDETTGGAYCPWGDLQSVDWNVSTVCVQDTDPADNPALNPAATSVVYESSGVLSSTTVTSTSYCPGISEWSNTTQGCDIPVNATAGAIIQQAAQDLQGFNGLLGTFAGASLVGGSLAAGAIASTTGAVPSILFGDIQSSFNFGASVQATTDAIDASRVFRPTGVAGQSQMLGSWFTTETYTSSAQAISELALGSYNQATQIVGATIPAGVTAVIGTAAPLFGQLGGGFQIFIQQAGCVAFGLPCRLPCQGPLKFSCLFSTIWSYVLEV